MTKDFRSDVVLAALQEASKKFPGNGGCQVTKMEVELFTFGVCFVVTVDVRKHNFPHLTTRVHVSLLNDGSTSTWIV